MRNKPIKINRPWERRRNWSKMEVAPLWVLGFGGFGFFFFFCMVWLFFKNKQTKKKILGWWNCLFLLLLHFVGRFQRRKILFVQSIFDSPSIYSPFAAISDRSLIFLPISMTNSIFLPGVSVVLVFINNYEQPSFLNNGMESFCYWKHL